MADGVFNRWSLGERDLQDLDAVKARDLIIKCFYEAQRETFARSKQELGRSADAEELMASVTSAVKVAFREVGGEFSAPTVATLRNVVDVLGRRAASWGTPKDIIAHHGAQIRRVLQLLS